MQKVHSSWILDKANFAERSVKACLYFLIVNCVSRAKQQIHSYLEAESLFNMAMASCTVVINCAGKIIVEFFSVAISAIVCSVRS